MQQFGFNYKLIGVLTRIGNIEHFIAYCKSPIDYQWYKYNDDIVSPVLNFQQEIIDNGIPYLLFYQKTDSMK